MSFEEFAHLASRFLVEEEEDTEAILRELKDAFRLYDKNGESFVFLPKSDQLDFFFRRN